MRETKCIDYIECINCGHRFDGAAATNYDVEDREVNCPKCRKAMMVFQSVEYTAQDVEV